MKKLVLENHVLAILRPLFAMLAIAMPFIVIFIVGLANIPILPVPPVGVAAVNLWFIVAALCVFMNNIDWDGLQDYYHVGWPLPFVVLLGYIIGVHFGYINLAVGIGPIEAFKMIIFHIWPLFVLNDLMLYIYVWFRGFLTYRRLSREVKMKTF